MGNTYRLQDYKLEEREKQILVLASGWEGYYGILKTIYGNSCKNRFAASHPAYQWGAFIDWSDTDITELDNFLKMLTNVVCIEDELAASFALGYHFHTSYEGEGRTAVGDKVYKAKPYKARVNQQHIENADVLAIWYKSFISRHPLYQQADYVVPVPGKPDKYFDLPSYIATTICRDLHMVDGSDYIMRIKETKSQKDVPLDKRQENVQDAFAVKSDAPFYGKSVIIVDDIYDTGSTINELGRLLKEAGATVYGLAATVISRRPS